VDSRSGFDYGIHHAPNPTIRVVLILGSENTTFLAVPIDDPQEPSAELVTLLAKGMLNSPIDAHTSPSIIAPKSTLPVDNFMSPVIPPKSTLPVDSFTSLVILPKTTLPVDNFTSPLMRPVESPVPGDQKSHSTTARTAEELPIRQNASRFRSVRPTKSAESSVSPQATPVLLLPSIIPQLVDIGSPCRIEHDTPCRSLLRRHWYDLPTSSLPNR
jgi:hypothetical protein